MAVGGVTVAGVHAGLRDDDRKVAQSVVSFGQPVLSVGSHVVGSRAVCGREGSAQKPSGACEEEEVVKMERTDVQLQAVDATVRAGIQELLEVVDLVGAVGQKGGARFSTNR